MTDRFIFNSAEAGGELEAQGLEVVVAAATTETAADDVIIEGRIITAENYDAASEGAGLLIVNVGEGSDIPTGGEGDDFVLANGSDAGWDDGPDILRGGAGNDVLLGGRGTDVAFGQEVAGPPLADALAFDAVFDVM